MTTPSLFQAAFNLPTLDVINAYYKDSMVTILSSKGIMYEHKNYTSDTSHPKALATLDPFFCKH